MEIMQVSSIIKFICCARTVLKMIIRIAYAYQPQMFISIGCMMVGYVYLGVVLGALFLFVRSWVEKRRRAGHAPTG